MVSLNPKNGQKKEQQQQQVQFPVSLSHCETHWVFHVQGGHVN